MSANYVKEFEWQGVSFPLADCPFCGFDGWEFIEEIIIGTRFVFIVCDNCTARRRGVSILADLSVEVTS